MQTELIKLKVKKESYKGENSLKIKSTFILACKTLDASIFEPLIDEDQYFQDLDKYRFLQSLKAVFEPLKNKGFTKTTMIEGTCQSCNCGERAYQFYTNNVLPDFVYYINEKNNGIEDIYRCHLSSGMMLLEYKILNQHTFWEKK